MKIIAHLSLFIAGAVSLAGAPVAAPGAVSAPKSASAQPASPAPKPASAQLASPAPKPASAQPASPGRKVPEKKQPYELWLSAHTKGVRAAGARRYEEAVKFFDEAIAAAVQPGLKNHSLYEKADALAGLGKYDEAVALLRTPVPEKRNTLYHQARVLHACGGIFMRQERYDEAEKAFREAVECKPGNWIDSDSRINLGRIRERRQDPEGALKYYNAVAADTSLLPGLRAGGILAAAELYGKRKEYAEALKCLDARASLEQLPADRGTELIFRRSGILQEMGNPEEALTALREAEKLPGKSPANTAGLYSRMARSLLSQKRLADAQNMIRRAKNVRGGGAGYDQMLHKQIDREAAKAKRIQQERERKARLERERKARLERERKARSGKK